jgi:predicted component of type VI protein secretion system
MTPTGNEPLVDALLTNGRAFAFSQAMRLLRRMVPKQPDVGDGGAQDSIRVRPKLSLAFPSADIDRIDAAHVLHGGPAGRSLPG